MCNINSVDYNIIERGEKVIVESTRIKNELLANAKTLKVDNSMKQRMENLLESKMKLKGQEKPGEFQDMLNKELDRLSDEEFFADTVNKIIIKEEDQNESIKD